jgi:hypothetical protein
MEEKKMHRREAIPMDQQLVLMVEEPITEEVKREIAEIRAKYRHKAQVVVKVVKKAEK